MGALDHLIRDYSEPIKDPVWNNILLSPGLLRVVALPAFQKLNGIRQLGPTYLVYPGATHTRLSHRLAQGPGGMPDSAREPEAVRAFLCAALLHDLGHYPFAHSLKELKVASHESLTAQGLLREEVAGVLRREAGADPELVAAIVDAHRPGPGGEALGFYRRLLSGVLDPDKLDYLNRDAYFCGVPHGVQDVDFALAELRALPEGLGVTRKGLTAVESILFSKYLMYRSVYWHKTVRIATAMIKKAVLLSLEEGALRPEELYWLDDQEFFALAARSNFPPLELAGRVARRRLFKQVASRPLDPEDPACRRLAALPERLAAEQAIAREASRALGRPVPAWHIIIDVPEPISFEIDLPVLDAGDGPGPERPEPERPGPKRPGPRSRPFAETDSVFSEATVRGFGRALRRVCLIAEADPELGAALERLGGIRLLECR
jgi:HD superfamily phosphohydrolase